jgi:hypothetical protein
MKIVAIATAGAVALLAGCSLLSPAPQPSASPSAEVSVAPASPEPTDAERKVTAQLYGLASELKWAPDGTPAPLVLTEDSYVIGDVETPLDVPGLTLSLFGDWEVFCLEGSAEVDGVAAVGAVHGNAGSFTRETSPGKTCAEVRPEMARLVIPTENFPGVNGFDAILVTTGTCIDFIWFDVGIGDPLEVPIVRDCAGPHEYVIVEADDLVMPEGPTDEEIEGSASALCGAAVNRWSADSGRDYLYTYYWFPTAEAFAEGDRAINCFAQVTEDVEQRTDGTDLYPS